MQVSVAESDRLVRRMTVEVPPDQIESEVTNRLQNMARTARIDGFRPGKIPLHVMENRFGSQVREQVVSEVMRTTLAEALQQENLQPVANPEIASREAGREKGLAYTAVFEVYPKIDTISLAHIRVEKPKAEASDQDLDKMIEKMRRQRQVFQPVERPAGLGDQVVIDFKGTVDGQAFEGGEAQNFPLVLGSNSLIGGFEEGLIGVQAGQQLSLDLSFPADYRHSELGGKKVQFAVTVHSVAEGCLPEVDEEFARSFGVADGNVETMREEIRKSMQLEIEEGVKAVAKHQIMHALVDNNPVEVPATLIAKEEEFLRLRRTMARQQGQSATAEALLQDEGIAARARYRAQLHIILSEIIKRNALQATPERLRETIDNVAASYDQPEEVVKWYYADPSRLKEMEWLAMEDMVVEWVETQVKVDERPSSFEDLMEQRKQLMNEF